MTMKREIDFVYTEDSGNEIINLDYLKGETMNFYYKSTQTGDSNHESENTNEISSLMNIQIGESTSFGVKSADFSEYQLPKINQSFQETEMVMSFGQSVHLGSESLLQSKKTKLDWVKEEEKGLDWVRFTYDGRGSQPRNLAQFPTLFKQISRPHPLPF